MKKVEINIKGMHCKSCVKVIESNISEMKGIEKINVSLIDNKATVIFDSDKIDVEKIKSEIENSGYSTGANPPNKKSKKKGGFWKGLMYGLIPHTGCIAFIFASILGVTVLMNLFKPLLMNRYFFHALIVISLLFATLSTALYLRNNGLLSFAGAKRKWKYITTMYGTTVGINLVLFFLIFPLLANVSLSSSTGTLADVSSLSSIKMEVDIPCPGHAPLISEELKSVEGVASVKFSFPDNFEVMYDSTITSKEEMFSSDVFDSYPETILEENDNAPEVVVEEQIPETNSVVNAGGSCGGSCGGSTCGSASGSCCGG
jgi:copper chaperone CopZ